MNGLEHHFLTESVSNKKIGVAPSTTVLKIESLPGKRRVFTPGRECTPLETSRLNKKILANCLKGLINYGWKLKPEQMVGISLLTEGAGVPFFEIFDLVWPNKKVGGQLNLWARRKLEKESKNGTYAKFEAVLFGDDNTLEKHPIKDAVGVLYDIGATGSTLRTILPTIVPWFKKLIFASPCTSIQAAKAFVETAVKSGMKPKDLAVVANEGFFGLDENGTFLSLQLPKTITSKGNVKLSKKIYKSKRFCHIGAGGLGANWQYLYEEELKDDEKKFGRTEKYTSLEEGLRKCKLSWPNDFTK